MDKNEWSLRGRLGADPEVRPLPSGGKVANFTVATNSSYPDRDEHGEQKIDADGKKLRIERTQWTRCVAWNSSANVADNSLKKGFLVSLRGEGRTRSWEDQEGVKRFVTELHVGIGGTRLDLMPNGDKPDRVESQADFPNPEDVPAEDLPF